MRRIVLERRGRGWFDRDVEGIQRSQKASEYHWAAMRSVYGEVLEIKISFEQHRRLPEM